MTKTSAKLSNLESKVIENYFTNTHSSIFFPTRYLNLAASLFEYAAQNSRLSEKKPNWFSQICHSLRDEMNIKIQNVLEPGDLTILVNNHKKIISFALNEFIGSDIGYSHPGGLSNDISEPREILSFLSATLGIEDGDTVYTPFAGFGTHILCSNHNAHFVGEEINAKVWAIAQLNIYANDLNAEIKLSDSFDELRKPVVYDNIMFMPPFMLRGINGQTEFTALKDAVKNKLHKDGNLVAILPVSFLFSNRRDIQDVRNTLIENRQLLAVMLLPQVSRHCAVKTCVICVTKSSNKHISFLDFSTLLASDEYVRKFSYKSALEVIEQNNPKYGKSVLYADLEDYTDFNLQKIGFSKELPEVKYPTVPLCDLVDFIRPESVADVTAPFVSSSTRNAEYISDYYIAAKDCEIRSCRRAIKVLPDSIVIFTITRNGLKYKYIKDSLNDSKDFDLIASMDSVNVKVNGDEILRDYLLLTLKGDYVSKQVENLQVGATIPRISRRDLENLQIPLPPVNEQKRLLKEEFDRINQLHSRAYLADEGRKDIYTVVSNLRHMLGSPFSNISVAMDNLREYLPDNEDYIQSLDYLRDNLDYVSRLIDLNCQNIDMSEKSDIDVEKFFRNYVSKWNNYGSKNFELRLSFNIDKGTYITGNETALMVLLDELLRNADKHGFGRSYSERNFVDISIELIDKDSDEPKILLDVSNNGKPFSVEFTLDDYITAGKFNKETGNSGLGGRQVYNICKSFGGDMDLITERNDMTTFLFFIPANR